MNLIVALFSLLLAAQLGLCTAWRTTCTASRTVLGVRICYAWRTTCVQPHAGKIAGLAAPIIPTTFDSPLPPSAPVYHYSDCQDTLIRVYEGPHGAEPGLRWGRLAFPFPTSPNGWIDDEIPNMDGTTFISLVGCTTVGLWRTWWQLPAKLSTTYDPVADTWSLPIISEFKRIYLPLTIR